MKPQKLTENEKSVLVAIVNNAKEVGDNGVEFILQDVAKAMNKSIRSVSATTGSLAKKGMLLTDNGESYFDGVVTDAGFHVAQEVNKVKQEVTNKTNTHMAKIYKTNGTVVEVNPKNGKDFKLEELQAIVGGYIEVLPINNKEVLVCDEEGKLKGYPLNIAATDIVQSNGISNYIVGDVLICDNEQVK